MVGRDDCQKERVPREDLLSRQFAREGARKLARRASGGDIWANVKGKGRLALGRLACDKRGMVDLPVSHVLPELAEALTRRGITVLQAPPGAGKTTLVPLDLLARGVVKGRILMLEPRRLAARASAERMAETLGEPVGRTVGYRIRGEAKVSGATRIEVVTEGILTRMIQADPELAGVGLVIFDEFHERSLNADLGLALCLEVRGALREDLKLLVMSATLDAAPVAELMGGPIRWRRGGCQSPRIRPCGWRRWSRGR